MHRQACLGMHSRIHALHRHHRVKANLQQLNVSEKVIQNKPFQYDSTILDGSNNLVSTSNTSLTATDCTLYHSSSSTYIRSSSQNLTATTVVDTTTDLSPI